MDCDFLVIGGGMAGASAAYALAGEGNARVILAEREETPGYHTTGRSAAQYTESYGHRVIRALTLASRPFLDAPPPGFAAHPLMTPRAVLHVARADQMAAAEATYAECRDLAPGLRLLDGAEAERRHSGLAPGYAACAVWEPDAMDMDVHSLHQGFLRGFRDRGGTVATDAGVRRLSREDGRWRIETTNDILTAGTVVNAAGAWADDLAGMAGLAPLGLVPKRRTVITFDGPAAGGFDDWPLTIGAEEDFYFKPDAGRILASRADETPMPPCDVQPDEMDVAVTVERIQRASVLRVKAIHAKWAGLRSFFADKVPVVGPDPAAPAFIWLAGQGGYGIQTAPAMGRLAAALATTGEVPRDMAALGVTAADVAPRRLRGGAS